MSLKPGWIIAIIMVWLTTLLIFGVTEMLYMGGETGSKLQLLFSPNFSITDPGGWFAYLGNIWDMLTWNYAFLGGPWLVVRWFLMAITGGLGFSMLVMFATILTNAVGSIFSLLRGGR